MATFDYENTIDSQLGGTIDIKADCLGGIILIMFIRTHQATGAPFYLWNANLIGCLFNGTFIVEVSLKELDEPPEVFNPYPDQLLNGYRHFIHITRMKDKMVTGANGSISIHKEISSIVPTQE